MSKGLGKVERAILEFLKATKKGELSSSFLVRVFHPDFEADKEDFFEDFKCDTGAFGFRSTWEASHSQYASLYRAINNLERKGFLTTEKQTDYLQAIGKQGGHTYHETVRLKR